MRKILLSTVCLMFILLLFSCEKKSEVTFNDADFAGVVAQAFSKEVSELTSQDLLSVEGIDVRYYAKYLQESNSYKNVWSVSVLKNGYTKAYDEYFAAAAENRENLTKPSEFRYTAELQSFNGYSDLNKFSAMTQLAIDSEYTIIKLNPLPFLIGLPALKHLSVYNFTVTDLEPVSMFPNLTELNIGLNPRNLEPDDKIEFISDATPLKRLTKLENLSLMGTVISDLSPLISLKNLKNLSCTMSSLSDISPVAKMTSLESVDFYYNAIEDVEPLTKLPNLEYIRLDYNYITDVSPFANLNPQKIKYITLEMNSIQDATPMKHLGENKVYVGYDLYWDEN